MLLKFDNVVLGYGHKGILPPISIDINSGDFLGVVGPNGVGKTTFLKTILSILKPVSGKIEMGEKIKFGYVPQRDSLDELFPFSVRQIVKMARYPGLPFWKQVALQEIDEALRKLDILDIANKLYKDLSGGQKQRTLIARALAANPDLLILDEPTNGMDIKAERSIMQILTSLNAANLTIVMVTHQLNLVATHARSVMLLGDEIFTGRVQDLINDKKLSGIYACNIEVFSDSSNRKIIIAS